MPPADKPPKPRPFLPLKGVRVLSFEVAYSLPAGTRTLAELGAEVVRVAGPGRDNYYISVVDGVYLSKPCIGINLKHPDGLATARELAAKADVICSNFVPGVMERLGLGYDELKALNPSAIVLQLSGYGSPGPWSNYAAFGPSTEAAGGMNQLVGPADGPPIRLGSGVFSDQLGGRFAALAIIAAIEQRQRTGQGKFIDLSMTEAISLLVGHTVLAAELDEPTGRISNRDREFAPQGVYPAAGEDEWLALTVQNDRQWHSLVRILREPAAPIEAAATFDAKPFATAAGRRARHDEIDAAIAAWSHTRDKYEAADRLQRAGIPAHAVQRARDPLFDEHLRERGIFQPVEHDRPILGYAAHPHPTTPWCADGHDRHQLRDLRFHGQDNAEVLHRWLNMEAAAVAALEESGALIPYRDIDVEARLSAYRDADHAEQLELPHAQEPPLSRDAGVGRGAGGEGLTAAPARNVPPATKLPLSQAWERGRGGEGLRILELSRGPAAAFAGLLLAELGHDVIRGEVPAWHLAHRPYTAELTETERAFLGRRKKSMEFGDGGIADLAAGVDAVIEDLGPGGLGNLRATVHTLRKTNPEIIVASISPYGHDGPKSRWEASELTIQASAGVLHATGWLDDAPQKAGGYPAHYIAGIHAATAILARAAGIRAGTCKGGRIELSMQETYLHHWTRHIGEWTYAGTKMRRERPGFGHQGFRHTAMAADGFLYVLSLYATWDEIALFFGLTDFLGAEWSSAEYRMEHWQEIEGPYLEIVASKPRYEWFRLAAEAGYTFAPVHTAADQASNPQFAARGFLKEAIVNGKSVNVPGLPFPWAAAG